MQLRLAAASAVVLALAWASGPARAQPAEPDFETARAHYQDAVRAARAGDFQAAASLYGKALSVTGDPVLHFRIAHSHQRAGACEAALEHYRRFIAEASPPPAHEEVALRGINACQDEILAERERDPARDGEHGGADDRAGEAQTGDAETGSGDDANGEPPAGGDDDRTAGGADPAARPDEQVGPDASPEPAPESATSHSRRTAAGEHAARGATDHRAEDRPAGGAGGSQDQLGAGPDSPAPLERPSWQRGAAWTSTGVAVVLAATGGLLAVSASAREDDVAKLAASRDPDTGGPFRFEGPTRERYESLRSEGETLARTSRIALGAAGVAAGAAAAFFVLDPDRGGELSLNPQPGGGLALSAGMEF